MGGHTIVPVIVVLLSVALVVFAVIGMVRLLEKRNQS
jgi:hypothetical protein